MKNSEIASAVIGSTFFAVPYLFLAVPLAPALAIGASAFVAGELVLKKSKKTLKETNVSLYDTLEKAKKQNKHILEMTKYIEDDDINKNLMSQLPDYTSEQIKELENNIDKKINNEYIDNQYFMLLCNDIHYYTVFHLDSEKAEFRTAGEGITYLLLEAGYTIVADEECEDHYEIWGKKDKEAYAFMFFPYD